MNKKAYNPFICTPVQRAMVYCQNILPLAFDNSLSYYEFLCVMQHKVNEVIKAVNNQNLTMVEFEKLISQQVESFEKYVNENFENLTTDYNNFKSEILSDFDTYKSEMNVAWTAYRNAINESLSDFASQISTLATDVENLATRTTAAESTISQHSTELSTLSTSLSTAEGNISQNTSDIDSLETRMTTAEGNISQNSGDISQNTSDISGLDTRVTALENTSVNSAGKTTPNGETITIDGVTYTAGNGAEYFNSYTGNNKNNSFASCCGAFGVSNNVLGNYSFAFGQGNSIYSLDGFAFGIGNTVNGLNCAVFGTGNETSDTAQNQLVCGEYFDNTNDDFVFAVGNGTSQAPSNAFGVDIDGYIFTPETPNGYIIKILTQTEYNNIQNPDTRTIYIIVSGGANT